MAVTLFLIRIFYQDLDVTALNLIPYLGSALAGVITVFLYLYAFPSQRKDTFLTFFIPGMVLMASIIVSGLADLWFVDELIFALAFILGGKEISKPTEGAL
ncbi:hypothetical protein GCM10010982_27600 [Bowmanella pacifica]|uniref:Uncharacterized protein n=2 Tax=Bowmanella pacifica TaxID=502051 RepID=A0A917Z0N2_9ALTE|nr:hypothetical protein GCM10010982_27600 [Bowmanella pacifica]